jgi:hypothetical protein
MVFMETQNNKPTHCDKQTHCQVTAAQMGDSKTDVAREQLCGRWTCRFPSNEREHNNGRNIFCAVGAGGS